MGVLKNQKHERFAQLIATGMAASAAYSEVYGKKGRSAEANGSRLMRNDKVRVRIDELQQKAADESVMSLKEKRQFLASVKRTPLEEVDESSPLCQSAEYTESGKKIKMPDKLKAIELDAKLAGEFKEKVEVTVDVLTETLLAIRKAGR